MADSVKGSAMQQYPDGIRQGIRMHRAIDTFTDGHVVFGQTKERLRKRFGKYAPVVADVFYDHFLAKHFEQYADMGLRPFTTNTYDFLKKYYSQFPTRTQRFYNYMTQYDILFGYAQLEGIDRVMKGMARRAQFESGMEASAEELERNYDEYEREFFAFFPEIQEHIRTFAP